MKAILYFAFLAVAAAIPLKDSEQVSIPESPISFEMLRNAPAFQMPVWRHLPIHILPEGDVFVAVPIPDAMLRHSMPGSPVSAVQVVDAIGAMPSNIAGEIVSNDVVPSVVNVVYAVEPEISSDDSIDMPAEVTSEIKPNSGIVADKVNVVYEPEINMLSEDVDVPNVAREITPNREVIADQVNVVYAVDPEMLSEDSVTVPELTARGSVKFVDGSTFDLKNMKVPIDAHDIV